ncbi:phosphate signaling complex protein PhoU [Shimia sp. R11_0]|uniref:Phosphate-specific transport system accessory protein PhoU n=1 Tax=Shimia marina TaxID=321267 RepID=A0A0P1FB66_9RHOB|nr:MULTISPECIES: phosphate signaling complex protein PhoU [Shimia]MBO9476997.1 phosphate signaling complex protein PhoU [Shimia sp. R11_0]CUH53662.1 PhoU-like phosphate uptake regulator [Shimia marina]SFD71694.1 phosphate uptake regulator, PhoU [Shimia marina]
MNDQHILSAFDRDLEGIQANVMKMGGLVEEAIGEAAMSMQNRDEELAAHVIKGDKAVDGLEDMINEQCANLIALRAPAAVDLRVVLSVMKIAGNLERIGDYAKNMAKRTSVLVHMERVEGAHSSLRRMAQEVQHMLTDVLDAFIQRDVERAKDVLERDHNVDQMYNALFREFLTFMMEDPRYITPCMHLHFMAKNTERMGDHVTAIAEQVIYLVTGSMPEEARPKATRLDA